MAEVEEIPDDQATHHYVTRGTPIRLEVPQGRRGQKSKQPTIVVHELLPVSGFVGFLREHAVVGLAIGFIIGTQAQKVVLQLVDSFINPLFQLFFGQALQQRTFTLHFHTRTQIFGWGMFLYILLNFLFVILAIYIIVKWFKLDKLDKPAKDEKKA